MTRLLIKSLYYFIALCSIILVFLYVFSDLKPVIWQPDPPQKLTGAFAKNTLLSELQPVLENVGVGPEDMALHPSNGMIYTAFENGDIVYFDPQAKDVSDSATLVNNTQGRPLGLRFDADGNLYVADALRGLLKIDQQGRITILATHYEGQKLQFIDHLAVAKDGTVYFSNASQRFTMHNFVYDFIETSMTGGVFAYHPESDSVTAVVTGLFFANGVALSAQEDFLLINETGKSRILKFWLSGDKTGSQSIFIDRLPAMPDNIYRDPSGVFWVGLINLRDPLVEQLAPYPFIRKLLGGIPASWFMPSSEYGMVIALDVQGNVIHNLQTATAYTSITSALPFRGKLYVASLRQSHLAAIPLSEL
jgi:sugar lactone lactonase YvrE